MHAYRKALGGLLRFSTSKSGDELASLQEVVSRMKANQKDIFFISADNKDAASSSPFVEQLSKKDLEVLFTALKRFTVID